MRYLPVFTPVPASFASCSVIPTEGDLGGGINAGGDDAKAGGVLRFLAEQLRRDRLRHRHPLGGCRVGKLDLRADVAYGVDAGHGGRERLVYRNSSPLDGKLRALAEQSRGIGTATDGDKHARRP